jgi:hypothetical protein
MLASKMLDVYATEIALLLSERRHQLAESQALAIPHIAVALSNAALQSSCAAYEAWCSQWVQPDFGPDRYKEWCVRAGECLRGDDVPFSALRALRLRRGARDVASPSAWSDSLSDLNSMQAVAYSLIGAQFRWYEREGRHVPLVQTNLARLGVLR